MRKYIVFTVFLILGSVSPLFADSESHTEVTTKSGTVVSDSSSKDSVGWTGTHTTEKDMTIVRDPKGLMNKTEETYHRETELARDGSGSDETSAVDAKGTLRNRKIEKEVSQHWLDSGNTTTTTRKDIVDPKGLMNKHETEVTEKVTRNADGSIAKRTITQEVDGEKVEVESVN